MLQRSWDTGYISKATTLVLQRRPSYERRRFSASLTLFFPSVNHLAVFLNQHSLKFRHCNPVDRVFLSLVSHWLVRFVRLVVDHAAYEVCELGHDVALVPRQITETLSAYSLCRIGMYRYR